MNVEPLKMLVAILLGIMAGIYVSTLILPPFQ